MKAAFDIEYTVGLKNGQRKYGVVLNKKREDDQVFWQFVPNNHVRDYFKSKNSALVERIPDSMISFVDCYSF